MRHSLFFLDVHAQVSRFDQMFSHVKRLRTLRFVQAVPGFDTSVSNYMRCTPECMVSQVEKPVGS